MNNRREDFPLLKKQINNHPLVYFDNAATSLKPIQVIEAIASHYQDFGGNPGRGTHELAFLTAQKIERTRQLILRFLNADDSYTVLFTKNATEGFNLVAQSIGSKHEIQRVITTELEHHSNLVPWFHYTKGQKHVVIPITADGVLTEGSILQTIKESREKSILAVTLASNVTGQLLSLQNTLNLSRQTGTLVLVDATQAIAHTAIDLKETPYDFLVASGHKMFGPEGIGFIVAKKEHLSLLTPLLYGGGAVQTVNTHEYQLLDDIGRFEAGTPHSAGIAGLNAAICYIQSIGIKAIESYEADITSYLTQKLSSLPGCKILGNEHERSSPIRSFAHETIHPHDIADYLNSHGVAVRAGLHCAEPLHKALKLQGSTRISLSFMNTKEEIDYVISVLTECFQKYA